MKKEHWPIAKEKQEYVFICDKCNTKSKEKCIAFDSDCDSSEVSKYTLELIEALTKVSDWFENGELIGKDLTFLKELIKNK